MAGAHLTALEIRELERAPGDCPVRHCTLVTMDLITLVLSVIVVAISAHLLFGENHPNAPPCIKGWIPWFGAGLEFGKAPLTFISQARDKVSGYSIV